MKLDSIIEQVIFTYKWDYRMAGDVALEYEKFMILRNENPNLSPPDNIDKFWHQHILNTNHYYNYCLNKFHKLIHHNPVDSLDQTARSIRLQNTIIAYRNKFGFVQKTKIWSTNNTREDVWNFSAGADYDIIYLKLIYIFDIYDEKGVFLRKASRKNDKIYDGKTIACHLSKDITIANLKKIINDKTNYLTGMPGLGINVFLTINDKKYDLHDQQIISNIISKNNSNQFLVVLEEISQNGYC